MIGMIPKDLTNHRRRCNITLWGRGKIFNLVSCDLLRIGVAVEMDRDTACQTVDVKKPQNGWAIPLVV